MKKSEIIKWSTTLMQVRETGAVLDMVVEEFEEFNIKSFVSEGVRSCLVSTKTHQEMSFKVILNAHLDVVPGSDDQFVPFVKDGRLYGRGAYDMKAAAAVEILVFKELADKVPYPLGLQLVTDEEVGGFKGTKYQVDQGVGAEFIVVGEPTNLDIGHKAKGVLWLKIVFKGESAHGAYLWQGKSAVWEMEKFLERLRKVYPVPSEEVWQTTVNVASVTTENTTYNKVPDRCEVKLDVRFIPEDKDVVVERLGGLLGEGTEMEIVLHESSQFTEEDNPYLVQLQKACAEVKGSDCRIIARHGGSDLRFFDRVGGRGVEFGPVGYGHHTDEEWVDIDSLEQYYCVLKKFLLSLN